MTYQKENINFKEYKEKLLFIPLGGSNEIGINVNLYHYKGKWIMIDCGSGFPDEYLPGTDIVTADLSFIEKHEKDLLGIILTHAHADHLGAILWTNFKCPIYATKFTANFLKMMLAENDFAPKMKINIIESNSKFDLGPFRFETLSITHSAPEMQAIMIRTDSGNILHTGDWKFDPEPVVGEATNEESLKKFGEEGILALTCDSTNVFTPGKSGSEGALSRSMIDIISGCSEMVVVTTFASNLARLETLIRIGEKLGRKIVLTGRSLHRMFLAAQESGYLLDIPPLLDERDIARFPRKELLVIATGCQGEPLAAVNKMVKNDHNNIRLSAKDTVIFSSKIIPGNEKRIFRLYNSFVKKGIEVITERDHFVHVSGHPSIDELKHMYDLVKPKISLPVHGEPIHLHEHAKLARKWGVPHAIEVENGSVVLLDDEEPRILGKVENGYLAVDGSSLLPVESSIFKMRRKIRESGVVFVSLFLDRNNKLIDRPIIFTPGILDAHDDIELINLIKQNIEKNIEIKRKSLLALTNEQIEKEATSSVRAVIKHHIKKTPIIMVAVQKQSGKKE